MDDFESVVALLVKLGLDGGLFDDIVAEGGDLDIDEIVRQLAPAFRESYGRPVLPAPHESVAVTLERPKTAALLYDRVWSSPTVRNNVPSELVCYGASGVEFELQMLLMALILPGFKLPDEQGSSAPPGGKYAAWMRAIAEALRASHNVRAVPLYVSREALSREYAPGDERVIFAILDNLQVVVEESLSWEQVLELRNDAQSRRGYRRLIHWLDTEMVNKPDSFIADEIAIRLENYHRALRKHGLKTVVGTVQSLIDPKFIAAASAAFAGVSLTAGVAPATIATLAIAGAQVACTVAASLLDSRQELQANFAEIALIHELKQRGGDSAG